MPDMCVVPARARSRKSLQIVRKVKINGYAGKRTDATLVSWLHEATAVVGRVRSYNRMMYKVNIL
jgi:hypothetical protein